MPPIFPGSSTFPGSTTFPGGSTDTPKLEVLYTTDDANDSTPNWQYAQYGVGGVGYCRSYSYARGRETELQDIDAGTASIELSARDRTFDAMLATSPLAPTNRWWIRHKFQGQTFDRFLGYADRYAMTWPEQGKDSATVVSCSDELKLLNLDNLPLMSPPRDTYDEVVQSSAPAAYYTFGDAAAGGLVEGTPGQLLTVTNSAGNPDPAQVSSTSTPIVGDPGTALALASSALIFTTSFDAQGTELDLGGLAAFGVEMWFKTSNVAPAANRNIWAGPVVSGGAQWIIRLNTTGTLSGLVTNATPTTVTVTSSAIQPNTWYHVVLTHTGAGVTLYLNGAVAAGPTALGGVIAGAGASNVMTFGNSTGECVFSFSKAAVYRTGIAASVIASNYQAGTQRGYPQQTVDARIGAVLDTVTNTAPRVFRTAARSIIPVFMHGQSPLDEARTSRQVEAADSMLYVSKSGSLVFLDANHRSSSPWNTVQAVFDDDGTDLPYMDTVGEYSDSFTFNVWNVTRDGGVTQTVSDASSILKNKTRPASLTGLLCVDDTAALAIATAMLAKYKNPLRLVPSVKPKMSDPATCLAALARELGDKIEVIRRPLGGGAAIDQTPWIQKISETQKPGEPIDLEFVVSPV